MSRQKKIMAVHDISCVGKCSLTVILPILSAAGIETAPLPTSLLSTHTGGFPGYTFHDLTSEMTGIVNHWKSLELSFDAVYTGYLGSLEQIDLMCEVFRQFGRNAMKVVDPVMADGGSFYTGFDQEFAHRMSILCSRADLILPNITEAAILLHEPYREGPYTQDYIVGLLQRLNQAFPGNIVLTGVYFQDTRVGAAALDASKDSISFAMAPWIAGTYHGTGDVFASALLASLLCEKSLPDAAQIAANFTSDSVRLSDPNREPRYGLSFERALPGLMKTLGIVPFPQTPQR